MQENERLQAQIAQLSIAGPSQQSLQLEEQNAKLLAENRLLVEEKNQVVRDNRELRAKQSVADPVDHTALIKRLKDEITALKKKAEEEKDSLVYATCGDCRYGHGIKHVLCSGCFMPASDSFPGDRKGSTQVKYYDLESYGPTVCVSDSDDEGRPTHDRSYYDEDRNTQRETRLEQGLFDWLQDWCLQNSDNIERQRVLERAQNEPAKRTLIGDFRDIEDEIKKTYEALAIQKKKKRQLRRKLIVLVDKTPVVTTDKTLLKKKLFTFCRVMSQPQQMFDCLRFPNLAGDRKLMSEREAVK